MQDRTRYNSVDALKGYAALGIVFMHVLANGKYALKGMLFVNVRLLLLYVDVSCRKR